MRQAFRPEYHTGIQSLRFSKQNVLFKLSFQRDHLEPAITRAFYGCLILNQERVGGISRKPLA